MPTLSVVIPIYNERDTWHELVRRVCEVKLPEMDKQLVLIDDASIDGTREQIQTFEKETRTGLFSGQWSSQPGVSFLFLYHPQNRGKGAALRSGFAAATGDFVIVQDADLEYDPTQYPEILAPLLKDKVKVVYGSRFTAGKPNQAAWSSYLANRLLTAMSNWTTGLTITDMETCYKAFAREVVASVTIEQNRFGFEPEITAKVAAMGLQITEVPIRYFGRTKAQGKKIGFKDGFNAMSCIWKYRPRKR